MPLDEFQAAARLGRKVTTLRKWRLLHKGPAYVKMHKSVVYMESDIEEFIEKNRIVPDDPLQTYASGGKVAEDV